MRNVREGERCSRIKEARGIKGQVGKGGWARPGGDNGVCKREALFFTRRRLNAQRGCIQKGGAALEKGDPAAFTEISQTTREFLDNPLLPGAQLADVNSGFSKSHAPARRLAGVFEHFGNMQQSLRGNTT